MPKRLLAQDLSVAEYAERWIDTAVTRLKRHTVVSYAQLLRLHILPAIGHRRMREVHRLHIKALLSEKRESGLSKNTVRLVRACVSAMFAEAVDDGLVQANPTTLASRRRGSVSADGISHTERHAAIRPFSKTELALLLDAARQDDLIYRALSLTLARTGLRPGEALALQWEEVDLGERELLVERGRTGWHYQDWTCPAGRSQPGTCRGIEPALCGARETNSRIRVERGPGVGVLQ